LRVPAAAGGWAYASVVPFGRDDGTRLGLRLHVAAAADPGPAAVAALASALGLEAGRLLRYADARAGRDRRIQLDATGRMSGFLLAGDTAAAGWLLDWLQADRDVGSSAGALLAGGKAPPAAAGPGRGAVVCSCNDVAEAEIARALQACAQADPGTQLAAVQRATRCGTTCGSCLPALQRRLQAQPTPQPVTP
jgi:assimilatory nitrate reductase catalytic subunit